MSLKGSWRAPASTPARVEDVVCGTVTQAGEQGANIGRLGVLLAGFPVAVPAVSLNRMCGSSQQAVHFAAQAIAAGDARYAIGCGVESMSGCGCSSTSIPDGRHGGFGGLNPALLPRHELIHQGESAERVARAVAALAAGARRASPSKATDARGCPPAHAQRELLATVRVDENGAASPLTRDEGVREQSTRKDGEPEAGLPRAPAARSPPATRARSPTARRRCSWRPGCGSRRRPDGRGRASGRGSWSAPIRRSSSTASSRQPVSRSIARGSRSRISTGSR